MGEDAQPPSGTAGETNSSLLEDYKSKSIICKTMKLSLCFNAKRLSRYSAY